MQEAYFIRRVAVLGAGVMGAQIAAHCVNSGIETLIFDLESKEGDANALVNKAITNLSKLKPTPLATPKMISFIQARNYQQNLEDLNHCDLIIEAIAERLDWKEDLYKRIVPHLKKETILVSNTSGLSINSLCQVLPKNLQQNFCGVHFFNPPRYMHLAELIPAKTTSPRLVDYLESWLTSFLGKGVIRAKDTPNFIANRIGVFSLLISLHHAEAMNISLDEIDLLTGPLLGRAKSATLRTMDVVGLDTMKHVVQTMEDQLENDPWHSFFKLPQWLNELIDQGNLGQKSGQGIYRKTAKTIEIYNPPSKSYQAQKASISADLNEIMSTADAMKRWQLLVNSKDTQARFITACFRDLFHYCAYHLEEIADTVRDVDLAMKWGFAWQQGPFETWQSAGLREVNAIIEKGIETKESLCNASLPDWLSEIKCFYNQEGAAFSPSKNDYNPGSQLAVYRRQFFPTMLLNSSLPKLKILFENEGLSLWHLEDEVAVINFKSKANTINQAVLDGLWEAIERAENECQGVIIHQKDASNFSSGADLSAIAALLEAKKIHDLEDMIYQFQLILMRIKYAAIPIISALRGRALGGGCELMMHCASTVAAFESYPGLVEIGVGLLPAGGGCKEMALRAASKAGNADLMKFIQPYFQQIATAAVASSAPDGLEKGYLRPHDRWLMHAEEVLYAALATIRALRASNYRAPLKGCFKIAGREGHARLQTELLNWLEGGFISDHDYFITNLIARVLCGGDLNQGEQVNEEWILQLEREAFMTLALNPLTQDRIVHLLKSGKPLRN